MIKRYFQPCLCVPSQGEDFRAYTVPLVEHDKGEWVKWEDYAALKNRFEQMTGVKVE